MPKQQAIPGHGMTPIEEAVMDRHDAGTGHDAIAVELGIKPAYVETIVRRYHVGSLNSAAVDARRGSAALLERLRAYHTRVAREIGR